MILALKVLLTLGGGLLVFMGFGFFTDPVSSAADFGIDVEGAHGLTSIRADMTAFFGVSGACFIWGAWANRSDPLIIGAALMFVTLATRLVALGAYGAFEGYILPMLVEALLGIFGIVGARILPKTTRG
ncbi:hypothetical protein CD351_15615 [Erythrobacter sp. KY5]|uniref:DUF4345 family protein n=1 Tax=Erythrobacter sp. KY5 TaxID=2011159 RepID=UPI000DBF1002|nr:DUF4345 family protein [Erythrobacter sp. KY5]AWW75857.1 hypothetical protein CD351_15615 [Erythrobacter sp. KY5]